MDVEALARGGGKARLVLQKIIYIVFDIRFWGCRSCRCCVFFELNEFSELAAGKHNCPDLMMKKI